jgi:Asp-tRNA(Asn)/Glu-tRNA(Gln) amidotransferase A subunit family amidase
VQNPRDPNVVAGGACAGSAAAVAAGHAVAALASDTLSGARIPAAFCGLLGHKPTIGELSTRGMATGLRRLDCPSVIARCVQDIGLLLPVMAGYDPGDPRSRKRRIPLAPPDWVPGELKAGVISDLAVLGVAAEVVESFSTVMARVAPVFGSALPVALEIAPLQIADTRRAALLLMEADVLAAHEAQVQGASSRVQHMLGYATTKSAVDMARAHRSLDAYVVHMRRLFEQFDVLLLPTTSVMPPSVDADEPPNMADLSALASLAGCPSLSLPLANGLGLQLVGAPGSDLRLLELGEVLSAVAEAGE